MNYTTLIQASQLAENLERPDWRIIDCRHDLAKPDAGFLAYNEAHIPGALFLHLDQDLSGTKTGSNGRHPLPEAEDLAAVLGRCGISNDTQVIAYDDAGGMFAARLWWLLRWLGHSRVAVLDGGLAAWLDSGQTLADQIEQSVPCEFTYRIDQPTIDSDSLLQLLQQDSHLVVDARAPGRFRGENEILDPVGGHIPGAVNRFFKDNLDPSGRFKPAAQLRAEFNALLQGRDCANIVNQCGSGVTACHNLLAMEIAGFCGARLYPGSWSEWCSDSSRPVAR